MADLQLTKDFKASEFRCPCGDCDGGKMDPLFMTRLQKLRDMVGTSLEIESGFRCAKHNAAVGGKHNSQHLVGRAADIIISNDVERFKVLRYATFIFEGIGINKSTIHVDTRETHSVAWTYYK